MILRKQWTVLTALLLSLFGLSLARSEGLEEVSILYTGSTGGALTPLG